MENHDTNNELEAHQLLDVMIYFGRLFFEKLRYIFKLLGNFLIYCFLFLRKNVIYLGVASLLGLGYSYYQSKSIFYYKMTVEPEEEIRALIYDYVAKYNANPIFSEVTHIAISPVKNNKEEIEIYTQLEQNLDTLFVKKRHIELRDFIEALNPADYRLHEIILTTNKEIDPEKTAQLFLKKIQENPTFKQIQTENLNNIITYKKRIEDNLNNIDSLLQSKATAIKNIRGNGALSLMATQNSIFSNDERLIQSHYKLSQRLHQINKKILTENQVIRVLSNLNRYQPMMADKRISYTLFGFLGMLGVLLLWEFNKFLSKVVTHQKK